MTVGVTVGVTGRRPARTAAGARALAEVNPYADALRRWTARRPRDPQVATGLVSVAFPYAVTLGQAGSRPSDWEDVLAELDAELSWYVVADGSGGCETAKRIKGLAGIIPDYSAGSKRHDRFTSRRSSGSSRSYGSQRHSYWSSGNSSSGWSSGGGFSADSGGGSVGGGDGRGGGGSW